MSITFGPGLLYPAFRIAGITDRPMRIPSADQVTEGTAICNRMIGSWNCTELDIFTSSIAQYSLGAGKKIYTIGGPGLGADFNVAAPMRIEQAHILLPGSPTYRAELRILTDAEWGDIRLQDIPGAIPSRLYPDYNFPLMSLYFYGQPPAGYSVEFYTWQRVGLFAATTDVVTLPDGYERAIVYNLALELAAQFTTQAMLAPDAHRIAAAALATIESRNAPVPRLKNDAAGLGRIGRGGNWNWWRSGGLG